MSRKTLAEWKPLVDQQIASGLSVVEFCQQHQLSPKYFYSRKSLIYKNNTTSGFVKAEVVTQKTAQLTMAHTTSITLNTAVAQLSLPNDTSAQFIVELLNGLAS